MKKHFCPHLQLGAIQQTHTKLLDSSLSATSSSSFPFPCKRNHPTMSIYTTLSFDPLFSFNHCVNREREPSIHTSKPKLFSLTSSSTLTLFNSYSNNYCSYNYASCKPHRFHTPKFETFATNTDTLESLQSSDVLFDQSFPIKRTELVSLLFSHLFFEWCLVCRESLWNTQKRNCQFFSEEIVDKLKGVRVLCGTIFVPSGKVWISLIVVDMLFFFGIVTNSFVFPCFLSNQTEW